MQLLCVVTMNTQLHRTLKTTPYEVVFGIKAFSEPVKSFMVTKEQDQASDTSEMSGDDISDSSYSSDRTKKWKRKHQLKETSELTGGNYNV